jgi:hypothetical protein
MVDAVNDLATQSAALAKLDIFARAYHHLSPIEYDARLLTWLGEGLADMPALCDDERAVIRRWRNM